MKNKDLIHVQIGREEALQSKKEILSTEINLLKIKQNMKNYHFLRKEELKIRLKLYRRIKELITTLNRLQKNLPQISIPPEAIKEEIKTSGRKIKRTFERTKENQYDRDLEKQLMEIQAKLRSLEG